MARVTFIGDPSGNDPTPGVEYKGTFFARDVEVDVSDDMAAKLATNSHFQVRASAGAKRSRASADESSTQAEG
ncbi:hypothetical protein IAG25_35575 [Caballeronia sp. EK]|uniref:hypothetical protein n=1 Tax=Caballeronia sp. EK TaxID=2767469 RepID=UPI0016564E24|nr:hypothetical protein [Caballeronia sp. EK]MBC8642128.1 hypothetical protein [Caballeronia sp. EK]